MYKYDNILFPDPAYYNSDEFPIEWLEIFQPRHTFIEIFDTEKIENLGITPFSNMKELNYLFKRRNMFKG